MKPLITTKFGIEKHNDYFYAKLSLITLLLFRYGPRESSKQQEFSQKDSEEKEFSSFIVQALEPALCLDKFPKAQVDIFITVIENDGNALSAGVLCASVALGEAGVEMYDLVSSCSLVQKGVTSIMDPTFEEVIRCLNTCSVAYESRICFECKPL
ncbi:Exosome complex component MTR3 [Acropora cervicornis]|uniref:Exosome complex component MTR3 n=1 Tax=Acropora cervicornis TaxID=6130 RepID=A0AAD9V3T6_ACRCE|nr:Exosome complex component MTR3 [Acropora cervicornis]